ncbi:MAG: 2-oxoacid:acceptor oxidoreductase subunit alpha [Candidatus Omnitrophota bacterium]|nr:2-oxoacid:acceptor oxidoreductase subunit alpha [Candidatus Omnitrophota bacterium]
MTQTATEVTVWIGGAAGDGIASAGESFAQACSRSGYHVFAYNSYQSVIRGGHVCMHVRIGTQKVYTQGDELDYLVALNQDTLQRYGKRVVPGGAVFYNTDKFQATPEQVGPKVQLIGLPVMELAGNQLMQNIALMGALMHVLGLDPSAIWTLIKERFAKKGEAVINANLEAFDKGMEFAKAKAQPGAIRIGKGDGKRRPLAGGNPMIGFGALAAGCRFYSAYPMTPASSLLHWLVKYAAKTGLLVKQCEDEIAAINMAIGAAHVGVRAMTGTSGGGFALMTEAVGEAGMTETPVVIVEAQRGGPSTGLPTKTEQGDLFQMLGASEGEFPKAILAPRTLEECYTMTIAAFNLAEEYQCPVLIATDLYLAERLETFDGVEITHIPIERGELLTQPPAGNGYRRFLDTKTGVSPRALPGMSGTVFTAATDEHDEDGIVISDVYANPSLRAKMMAKRMRKLAFLLQELPPPQLDGPRDADLTLVGWGSTYQVMLEAMHALNAEGFKVNVLGVRILWPFQTEAIRQLLSSCRMTMSIENNYTGQLVKLIRMETGCSIQHHLRKFDGEPFEPKQVVDQARTLLKTKPTTSVVATVVSDEGLPPDFSPMEHPAVGAEVARQH